MESQKILNDGFKLRKDLIYAIAITAIIVFAISYFSFAYIPKMQEKNEINEYKRLLYGSVLCQYKCPLVEQQSGNKTSLLPTQECVQGCTKDFKDLQQKGEAISNEDLLNDNLISDIENIVKTCKDSSIDQTATIPSANNTLFFSCVIPDLESLENKYRYLR